MISYFKKVKVQEQNLIVKTATKHLKVMSLKETLAHFKGVDTDKDVLQLQFYDDQEEWEKQVQISQEIKKYIQQASSKLQIPKRLAALLYSLLDKQILTDQTFAQYSQHYESMLINAFIGANPGAVKDKALEEANELEFKEEAQAGRRQSIRETNSIFDILVQAENTSLYHQNEGESVWVNLQKFSDEELLRFHLELLRRENKLNSNIEVVLICAQYIEKSYTQLGKKLVDVIKKQEI